jgi:hypothetical protein
MGALHPRRATEGALLARRATVSALPASQAAVHLRWFALGAILSFFVPYLGTSAVRLQHDWYLAMYFAFVGALVTAYARATKLDIRSLLNRQLVVSVLAGIAVLALLIVQIASETQTRHPGGFYFAFELIWRGGIYGAVDAVLLTAFPCAVVYSAMGGRLTSWRRRSCYIGVSLGLVMLITATYHLGYREFRQHSIGKAETGNVLMSISAFVTGANPVGSIVAHSGMHVAAVVHEYETDSRVPPHTPAR